MGDPRKAYGGKQVYGSEEEKWLHFFVHTDTDFRVKYLPQRRQRGISR